MKQRFRSQAPNNSWRSAVTIVVLSFGSAVGIGMARFAYALILPDMRVDLGWTYAQSGFLNTANAIGYLGGAISATFVVQRLGGFNALVTGSVCCVIGLTVSALTSAFVPITFARVLTGLGAAFSIVAGGALATAVAKRNRANESFLLTLFYIGPGIGITLSGIILPPVFYVFGAGSWWLAWAALALICAILTALLLAAKSAASGALPKTIVLQIPLLPQWRILLGYFIFGAGGMAYMTFAVAWIADHGGPLSEQALFWLLTGTAAIAAPWIWSRFIARFPASISVASLIAVTLVGSLAPLIITNLYGFLLSGVLFGSACLTVVAATSAFVRRNFSERFWPAGIGVMTAAFAGGQIVGPLVSGWLADLTNSLSVGLWFAPASLALGAILCGLQRDLRTQSLHPV